MSNQRFVLTDPLWQPIAPLLPGQARDPWPTARDNRLFLEAVLWRVRTGAPWRHLPASFGNGNSRLGRFRPWAASGGVQRLFETLSGDPDLEYVPIDGAIVWVHQKAAGAKGALGARGRSCGGLTTLTTKMVAMVDDALGHLVRFFLLPGQSHESKGVAPLLSNVPVGALLAEKALDNDGLLRELPVRGATAVIPPKANRKERRFYDREAYKWRHLMENFFARIKGYRCIATRYDKTASSYAANRHLVATLPASR